MVRSNRDQKVLALLATTWAIVQFATMFVFSFPALLLTRVVLGAGEGPSYGTSVAAATPWLPFDRRAFGLAIVSFGSVIGPALFAPLLTFLIVVVGWRSAFALLGGIGLLWVVIWLLVGREHPEKSSLAGDETYVGHPWMPWSQILPIIFSCTVIFSTLAGFSVFGPVRCSVGTRSTWSLCVTSSSVIPSTLQGSRFPIL